MVEFQIVDDSNFRQVMNELAALVEKRRVVFVRGSKTAQIFSRGYFIRNALIVSRIAVG